MSLNPCEVDWCGRPRESGIPFYLPKPLLIVAKNFRNVEEAKVGLTDTAPIPTGYDDQSKYADLNARTNFQGLQGEATSSTGVGPSTAATNTGNSTVSGPRLHSNGAPLSPGVAPSDGLGPATFYTYHIVFVPDLTQKYGLKIRGGPGEIRAAMNLVNGWQFTGIGPFYMKDSATAQNILANGISARLGGQAAADILSASADLAKAAGVFQSGQVAADDRSVQALSKELEELKAGLTPMTLPNFAEIHVYEARLGPAGMEWAEIVGLSFNRDYLGKESVKAAIVPSPIPTAGGGLQSGRLGTGNAIPESVARAAVAGVFGLPTDSPSLGRIPSGGLQSGGLGEDVPPAYANQQVQVDCGRGECRAPGREFNLFRFGGNWERHPSPQASVVKRRLITDGSIFSAASEAPPEAPAAGGGAIQ